LANKKITELNNLQTPVANTQFVAVDIENDETKSVTLANLISVIDTNENQNVVQIQSNVASIVDTDGHTVTLSANLIPSADGVYDLGSASAKWKDLHLTGASIKLGGITISDLGNEGITITGSSGEQANVVTPTLGGAANISANIATLEATVITLETNTHTTYVQLNSNLDIVQDNVATLTTDTTNEDTALQARIDANALVAAANDFVTYTRLSANIDLVQDNVAAIVNAAEVETRLNANLDIVQDNVAAITTTVDNFGTYANTNLDTKANVSATYFLALANDFATYALINANLNIVQDNVATLTTTVDNFGTSSNANATALALEDAALQTRLGTNVTALSNEDTALQSRLATNVTAFTNEDTALQARIAANTLVAAANDFVTYTRLTANIDLVQDNVAAIVDASAVETRLNANLDVVQDNVAAEATAIQSRLATNVTAFTNEDTALQARIAANTLVAAANDFVSFTRLQANIDLVQDNVSTASSGSDGVEARRVANIAGAVSTITTGNLTASRALASDGAGKVAVATTTLAELNHVSGVTAAIQTQLDAVEARRAANNITTTFTDDVIVTGNLTINGDTTTINTTNMDVDDTMIMLANGTTGSPANDIGILFNRGNQGNAAFFYDESAKTFKLSDTKDPTSNTSLSPVTASNLNVGIVDAATLKYDGLSVHTAITDNVASLTTDINTVSSNTAAVEARRVANIAGAISTVLTGDLTGDRVMITNGDGKIAVSSAVTPTELGMIDGITLGTTAASKAVTSDASGDTSFSNDLAVVANTTLGTNASNTVTIVGILDCGAFS